MDKVQVEAFLGRTRYVMEEDTTPNVIKVTRFNADGEKAMHFSKELIAKFVIAKVEANVGPIGAGLIKKILG